jgi:predicted nucleic acid-binding protein
VPPDLYLVDSSAWILALQTRPCEPVKDRVAELLREAKVVTVGIIRLELLAGTRSRNEYHRLRQRLGALDVIPSDEEAWDQASELAFDLRRGGLTVPCTDILIAACALRAGATVVHADRHFDLMADPVGLKVESFVHMLTGSE